MLSDVDRIRSPTVRLGVLFVCLSSLYLKTSLEWRKPWSDFLDPKMDTKEQKDQRPELQGKNTYCKQKNKKTRNITHFFRQNHGKIHGFPLFASSKGLIVAVFSINIPKTPRHTGELPPSGTMTWYLGQWNPMAGQWFVLWLWFPFGVGLVVWLFGFVFVWFEFGCLGLKLGFLWPVILVSRDWFWCFIMRAPRGLNDFNKCSLLPVHSGLRLEPRSGNVLKFLDSCMLQLLLLPVPSNATETPTCNHPSHMGMKGEQGSSKRKDTQSSDMISLLRFHRGSTQKQNNFVIISLIIHHNMPTKIASEFTLRKSLIDPRRPQWFNHICWQLKNNKRVLLTEVGLFLWEIPI